MYDKISKIQCLNKELHFKTLTLPNTFFKTKVFKKNRLSYSGNVHIINAWKRNPENARICEKMAKNGPKK